MSQPTKSSANGVTHKTDGEKHKGFFAQDRRYTETSLAEATHEYAERAQQGALSTVSQPMGGAVSQPTKSSANGVAHKTDGEKHKGFFAWGRMDTMASLMAAKEDHDRRAEQGLLTTVPTEITFRMDERAARKPKAPPNEVSEILV